MLLDQMSASPKSPTLTASSPSAAAPAGVGRPWRLRERSGAVAVRIGRPELWALVGVTAFLNLWDLSRNSWANTYYSATVRSMSSSWHDFLYASFDRSGVMTVDKPPLALWVQSLSVRVFGYHPLSLLVPQALMGIASVVLVYDLVRRRFGRLGGFVAGLALSLTPMTVAISRHNNPDALLVLTCVAARVVRGPGPGRRTHPLARARGRMRGARLRDQDGRCPGRGPWHRSRLDVGRTRRPRQAPRPGPAADGRGCNGAGGRSMAGAGRTDPRELRALDLGHQRQPRAVADLRIQRPRSRGRAGGRPRGRTGRDPEQHVRRQLGPAAALELGPRRPGRLAARLRTRQRDLDPDRLARAARGPQDRVADRRGGSFLAGAVLFSFASGIFHPYYVALLAPFLAALVGAGAGELFGRRLSLRLVAPVAIATGVIVELVIRGHYPAQLHWLPPVLVGLGVLTIAVLALARSPRARAVALTVALAALLLAPAAWAFDTLSYATSSTFPSGGPASAENEGQGFGAGGRNFLRRFGGAGAAAGPALFGSSSSASSTGAGGSGAAGGPALFGSSSAGSGGPPAGGGVAGGPPSGSGSGGGARGGGGFGGSPFGGNTGSLNTALSYIDTHGGGTLALSSQSGAAEAIIARGANVVGIGGFSGRESEVSRAWLANEVRSGKIRWVLAEETGPGQSGAGPGSSGGLGALGGNGFPRGSSSALLGGGRAGGPGGETRVGSKKVMAVVEKACSRVELSSSNSSGTGNSSGTATGGLYDCSGDAQAIAG